MKTILLACLFIFSIASHQLIAQNSSEQEGNFVVVIGAFSSKENASKLSKQAIKDKLQTKTELNSDKNLTYVYVLQTDDHDKAIAEAKRLQAMDKFRDAWVFTRRPVVEVIEPVVVVPVEEKKVVVEEVKPVVVPVDPQKLKEEQMKAAIDKKTLGKKGEMEKLDFIFFYKDASVLRPESKFAVDKLVQLMKENPKEMIRIHGHTNGNDPGKIIRHADDKFDFFSLDNTIEDYGSAKKLSELRAEAIRDYLVANGIAKNRMSVKAWGGKKPIYKVDDDKAEANVRVEIEVVKEVP